MSALTDVMTPEHRRVAYVAFALVSVVVGAVTTGFVAVGSELPVWLTAATAVLGYTGTALGLTAGANTVPSDPGGGESPLDGGAAL